MGKARRRTVLFLASGFGAGLFAPFAPGTFGSLPGVALAFATTLLPFPAQLAVCAALTALAVPLCTAAERILGVKDDGRIAADEWMLFPLAVAGLPLASLPWHATLAFFCIVRAIDIVKPPPARRLQDIPGGLGIVLDDLAANIWSLGLNWSVFLLFYAI